MTIGAPRWRIGIMQGRLLPSATGALDCPPGPRWREEFEIAASIGLHHIELVADRVFDVANPLWSTEGRREISALSSATGVRTVSVCANETVERPFDDAFGSDLATRLGPAVEQLSVQVVVLPLLDASSLARVARGAVVDAVGLLGDRLHERGAHLALEVDVPATDAERLLAEIAHPAVGVCYDTGNAAASGYDIAAEVKELSGSVRHVHAKDKSRDGENVRFGTGIADLAGVLATLAGDGYDGLITMEATRGDDPVTTATEHRDFLLARLHDAVPGRPA
jgi:hexulose-6-phosphate isomerase